MGSDKDWLVPCPLPADPFVSQVGSLQIVWEHTHAEANSL